MDILKCFSPSFSPKYFKEYLESSNVILSDVNNNYYIKLNNIYYTSSNYKEVIKYLTKELEQSDNSEYIFNTFIKNLKTINNSLIYLPLINNLKTFNHIEDYDGLHITRYFTEKQLIEIKYNKTKKTVYEVTEYKLESYIKDNNIFIDEDMYNMYKLPLVSMNVKVVNNLLLYYNNNGINDIVKFRKEILFNNNNNMVIEEDIINLISKHNDVKIHNQRYLNILKSFGLFNLPFCNTPQYAISFMDEQKDNKDGNGNEGGRGKDLLLNSIFTIFSKNQNNYINIKLDNIKNKKTFIFNGIKKPELCRSIIISEIRDIKFENLYDLITSEKQVEYKYDNNVINISPTVFFSYNKSIIKNYDSSSLRRIREIYINNTFSFRYTPYDHYKKYLGKYNNKMDMNDNELSIMFSIMLIGGIIYNREDISNDYTTIQGNMIYSNKELFEFIDDIMNCQISNRYYDIKNIELFLREDSPYYILSQTLKNSEILLLDLNKIKNKISTDNIQLFLNIINDLIINQLPGYDKCDVSTKSKSRTINSKTFCRSNIIIIPITFIKYINYKYMINLGYGSNYQ